MLRLVNSHPCATAQQPSEEWKMRRRRRLRLRKNMSEKLAAKPEIESPRLSSRGCSWDKAEAKAEAKEKHERKTGSQARY